MLEKKERKPVWLINLARVWRSRAEALLQLVAHVSPKTNDSKVYNKWEKE